HSQSLSPQPGSQRLDCCGCTANYVAASRKRTVDQYDIGGDERSQCFGQGTRGERIAKRLDPARPFSHHAIGLPHQRQREIIRIQATERLSKVSHRIQAPKAQPSLSTASLRKVLIGHQFHYATRLKYPFGFDVTLGPKRSQ